MNNYIPKLSHAVTTCLLGIIFIGALAYASPWQVAFLVGAIAFISMSALIFALLFLEQRRSFYHTVAYFADRLAQLDPDQWQALGIAFPHLRIRWSGQPIQFFEDTSATMEQFERFMRDSDHRQISPERNWSGGPQRRAWREIVNWLQRQEYIYKDSAAGNHSWLWRGDMRRVLWQRYIKDQFVDVNKLEEVNA
jgi:hypothetical protein